MSYNGTPVAKTPRPAAATAISSSTLLRARKGDWSSLISLTRSHDAAGRLGVRAAACPPKMDAEANRVATQMRDNDTQLPRVVAAQAGAVLRGSSTGGCSKRVSGRLSMAQPQASHGHDSPPYGAATSSLQRARNYATPKWRARPLTQRNVLDVASCCQPVGPTSLHTLLAAALLPSLWQAAAATELVPLATYTYRCVQQRQPPLWQQQLCSNCWAQGASCALACVHTGMHLQLPQDAVHGCQPK